jgi:hypothetical protein
MRRILRGVHDRNRIPYRSERSLTSTKDRQYTPTTQSGPADGMGSAEMGNPECTWLDTKRAGGIRHQTWCDLTSH